MRKDISGAPSNPEMALDQGNPGGSKAGSLDLDLPHGTPTWEEHIRRRHSLLPLRPAGSQPVFPEAFTILFLHVNAAVCS